MIGYAGSDTRQSLARGSTGAPRPCDLLPRHARHHQRLPETQPSPGCPGGDADGSGRSCPVRNHAKLLAIDHSFIIVTSANLSWSAKKTNVEFGVLIDNRNLTEAAEEGLYKPEDLLFEAV